jgi:hypothetical protein
MEHIEKAPPDRVGYRSDIFQDEGRLSVVPPDLLLFAGL